jgi:hypothetical protein
MRLGWRRKALSPMPRASAPIRCDHVASVLLSEALLAPAAVGSTSTSASKTMQAGVARRHAGLLVWNAERGLVPAIATVIAALVVLSLLIALVVRALLVPGLVVGLRVVSLLIDLIGSICDVVGGALLIDPLLSGLRRAVGRSRSLKRRCASSCKCRCNADPARKREERRDHGELVRAHRASFHFWALLRTITYLTVFGAETSARNPETPFRVGVSQNLKRNGSNSLLRLPGEGPVTFVSVPDAAQHGIETANAHAGQTFFRQFGEVCTVVQN